MIPSFEWIYSTAEFLYKSYRQYKSNIHSQWQDVKRPSQRNCNRSNQKAQCGFLHPDCWMNASEPSLNNYWNLNISLYAKRFFHKLAIQVHDWNSSCIMAFNQPLLSFQMRFCFPSTVSKAGLHGYVICAWYVAYSMLGINSRLYNYVARQSNCVLSQRKAIIKAENIVQLTGNIILLSIQLWNRCCKTLNYYELSQDVDSHKSNRSINTSIYIQAANITNLFFQRRCLRPYKVRPYINTNCLQHANDTS